MSSGSFGPGWAALCTLVSLAGLVAAYFIWTFVAALVAFHLGVRAP